MGRSGQLMSEAIILLRSESLAWKRSVTERSEKFGLEATLKPFLKHPVFTTDDPSIRMVKRTFSFRLSFVSKFFSRR